MKTLTPFFVLLIIILASFNLYSQDNFMPPKPLENKAFESIVGEWSGTNEMMGMKMNENVNIYWGLNKQFLFMDLTSASEDNSMKVSGRGIFSINKEGKVVGWWFDDWGADFMMQGTGTTTDSKIELASANSMMKDWRSMEVKEGKLVMDWRSSWMEGGQEKEMKGQTVFNKK